MKKIFIGLAICLPLVMSACSNDDDAAENAWQSSSPASLTLKVGETGSVAVTGTGSTYQSSDEFVATVSTDGTVTGRHVGETQIYAAPHTFNVTVTGIEKSNLEVVTTWDAKQETVKKEHQGGQQETGPENTLYYTNIDEEGAKAMYHFTGPQLKAVNLLVPAAQAQSYIRYLQERYQVATPSDEDFTPVIGYNAQTYPKASTAIALLYQGKNLLVTFYKAQGAANEQDAAEKIKPYITTFNNHVMLKTKSITLYVGEAQSIETNFDEEEYINYQSERPFVASVNGMGEVTGNHVGTTTVTVNDIPVSVTVKGKVNLYTEPVLDWGTSMSYVINHHQAGGNMERLSLLDNDGNKKEDICRYSGARGASFIYYYFGLYNKLNYAEVYLKANKGNNIIPFLAERYNLIQDEDLILGIDGNTPEETSTLVAFRTSPQHVGAPDVNHPIDDYYIICYEEFVYTPEAKQKIRQQKSRPIGTLPFYMRYSNSVR